MALGKRFARSRSAADSSWTGMPLSLWKETVVWLHGYRGRKRLRFLHVYGRDWAENNLSSTGRVCDENAGLPPGVQGLPGRDASTACGTGVCAARETRD